MSDYITSILESTGAYSAEYLKVPLANKPSTGCDLPPVAGSPLSLTPFSIPNPADKICAVPFIQFPLIPAPFSVPENCPSGLTFTNSSTLTVTSGDTTVATYSPTILPTVDGTVCTWTLGGSATFDISSWIVDITCPNPSPISTAITIQTPSAWDSNGSPTTFTPVDATWGSLIPTTIYTQKHADSGCNLEVELPALTIPCYPGGPQFGGSIQFQLSGASSPLATVGLTLDAGPSTLNPDQLPCIWTFGSPIVTLPTTLDCSSGTNYASEFSIKLNSASSALPNYSLYIPGQVYVLNQVIIDTVNNNTWKVTITGTPGSTTPSWPATPTIGTTQADNTVTWTCTGINVTAYNASGLFDWAHYYKYVNNTSTPPTTTCGAGLINILDLGLPCPSGYSVSSGTVSFVLPGQSGYSSASSTMALTSVSSCEFGFAETAIQIPALYCPSGYTANTASLVTSVIKDQSGNTVTQATPLTITPSACGGLSLSGDLTVPGCALGHYISSQIVEADVIDTNGNPVAQTQGSSPLTLTPTACGVTITGALTVPASGGGGGGGYAGEYNSTINYVAGQIVRVTTTQVINSVTVNPGLYGVPTGGAVTGGSPPTTANIPQYPDTGTNWNALLVYCGAAA